MAATSVLARQASSASSTTTQMPLTTVFTPAASCAEKPYTFFSEVDGLSTFWHGADGNFSGTQEACFPSGYAYQHQPGVSAEYSPGVCPQGYAGAQVVQNGAVGAISSWCCPSGMTYAANYGCESLISASTVLIMDSTENVTLTTPFLAVDWYIKVAWASSELDIFTPASAPVLAAVTSDASTSVVTDSPTASPDSAESAPQGPSASQTPEPAPSLSPATTLAPEASSLSTGAKAGIGVGVAVGVLIAAAVLFLWYRKRRQRVQPAVTTADTKSELDGSQANLPAMYGQVPQSEIFEADGVGRPPEADSGNAIVEMEGSWHGHELDPKVKR